MCGISAYVGERACREPIVQGLERLEYRGYDSAGIAYIDQKTHKLTVVRAAGRLSVLCDKLARIDGNGTIGIGHTRWATHGVATEENAHPHPDCSGNIAVVHNGIIENFQVFRERLSESGHQFHSDTDTEVVSHLVEEKLALGRSLYDSALELLRELTGAYALVILTAQHPDMIVAIRRKSPLCIGVLPDGYAVASDPMVFSDISQNVIFLPEDSFALVTRSGVLLHDIHGKNCDIKIEHLDAMYAEATTEGHDHFLIKEISEQQESIERTIRHYEEQARKPALFCKQLGLLRHGELANLEHIFMVAAGTSSFAACIASRFFELIAGIPASVHLSSEFRYVPVFIPKNSVCIGISQSGETADTLEAVRLLVQQNVSTIALTNVASSTMVFECDGALIMQAGPEISVASTKAFSAQVASLYWFAHWCAVQRGMLSSDGLSQAADDLAIAGEVLASSIERYRDDIVNRLAPYYAQFDRVIFLGRTIGYYLAQEAALKLKEITYIFAQSYPAGELKHGPIALVDEHTPIIMFSVLDEILYPKLVANAQEVKARKGHLLIFAFEGQDELISLADEVFIFPRVAPLLGPLAMTGLMQFWVYQIAVVLGRPIDKPRNLAKSVTVE